MAARPDNLKHIVVLMMGGRSFDHMLGALRSEDPRIVGLTGSEANPDATGEPARVQPLADFQGQLDPTPNRAFPAVQKQLFSGNPRHFPSMQGFVQSYWDQRRDPANSRKVMYYFAEGKLPVLHTLARSYAVFNGWFSSVPGPASGNLAFAHFGTSFGAIAHPASPVQRYPSVFDRLLDAGLTARLYRFDDASANAGPGRSVFSVNRPQLFATYPQFLADCRSGALPAYSFVEPNYTDHLGETGQEQLASDQRPDHNVQMGELFIASIYNAIRANPQLWQSTALLITYDEHGGVYDHVPPPACTPDEYTASLDDTGGIPFAFERLGVRVPAILISPWVRKGTVVPGPEDPQLGRAFEHASIPATVAQQFLGESGAWPPRVKAAPTFLDVLGDELRPDSDCPMFDLGNADPAEAPARGAAPLVQSTAAPGARIQELAGYQSDDPEGQDLLGITGEVEALAAVLAAKEISPPLSLGIFGNWGSGKSFFMRRLESRIRILQEDAASAQGQSAFCENIVQIAFNAWNYIDTSLWASLTSEIFEGLAGALARRRGGDSQEQRARVLAAASSSQTVLQQAERNKSEADAELRQVEERLAALQNSQADVEARLRPAEIFEAAYDFAVAQPDVQAYIRGAAKELHVEQVEAATGKLKAEILELRGIWNAVRFTMRHTERLWIWLVAVGAAVALGWGSTLLLKRFSVSTLMEEATAVIAAASGFLAWFLPGARKALKLVEDARQAQRGLIEQKQAENRKALEDRRQELTLKVEAARQEAAEASGRAAAVARELEQLRADRRLADYIRQRNESTDYTQHLGLIARVRTDFKQLSTLLRDAQEEAGCELKRRQRDIDPGQMLFPRIDRIVLYIDDLDRCPEQNVMEVLQAVHLLLAFPLFVVVVGVDPRWLLHSVEQHSPTLRSAAEQGSDPEEQFLWDSTPLNYLEKIFQIPYTLRPMDSVGFGRVVDRLSTPAGVAAPVSAGAAAAGAAGGGAAADAVETSSPAPQPEPAAPEKTRQIERKPEHLRIEVWEQSFMKLLHELIPSPRAGKRFINIYRLLRATVNQGDRDAFIGGSKGGDHQCALLLLAILTGQPAEATEILRQLMEGGHDETWWMFIDALKKEKAAQSERWEELFRKLDKLRGSVEDRPCATFAKWAPDIARYSFQAGRILLTGDKGRTP